MLMDISTGAFGVDLLASRVYFINPVLDPQVEAQAIGRARRTSQKRSVTVETLVLRDSLEELILRRREEMTPAEQRKCKSILDDRPIYEWILNARILPLPDDDGEMVDGLAQTAMLQEPQLVFRPGSGRAVGEADGSDLVPLPAESSSVLGTLSKPALRLLGRREETPAGAQEHDRRADSLGASNEAIQLPYQNGQPRKRTYESLTGPTMPSGLSNGGDGSVAGSDPPSRRVRFAGSEED
jgi:hypothetical protein